MSSRLDDRHRFFLKHADQIREWFELEAEVRRLLQVFVEEHVQALAIDGGPWDDDVIADADDGQYGGLSLYRPGWQDGSRLGASVRLEWNTRNLGLDDGSQAPYVGIRAEQGGAARVAIDERLGDVDHAYNQRRSRWWPAWRYVEFDVTEDFTLQAYGEMLTAALATAWTDLAPIVDTATTRIPPAGEA